MSAEMLTVAEAAAERGISASRMRDLIREHRVVAPSRQPGRSGGNLYPAEALRAIPGPGQGRRNDLLGERIGRMFAAARAVAEARGARDEWDKHYEQVLAGNPSAVRAIVAAATRWTKRKPVAAAVMETLLEVERLAGQIGDLPAVLPMAVRSRLDQVIARLVHLGRTRAEAEAAVDAALRKVGT